MFAYILRRLFLVVPTLLGIVTINFFIIQAAPGGPVEQTLAELQGIDVDATARFSGAGADTVGGERGGDGLRGSENDITSRYRGARGLDPDLIREIEQLYGFDKPMFTRYVEMLVNYARFDFGESFRSNRTVVELVVDKMPVSISLGVWTTLLAYLISIPLGIAKAVRDGSRFDVATSYAVIIGMAIPSFLFAILLMILFAGGSFWQIFPLRGLISPEVADLPWYDLRKVLDYLWHLVLPIGAMAIGGFATLTLLTKNSFLDEINKQYVMTARSKGMSERRVLYGHVFRNAMLIVIAGFPGAFLGALFTGSLLIENIFSLDGLGLLGFESVINRDYPVVFGTLWFFSLIGLLFGILSDLMYVVVDPRIDFESRTT
ncbi:MAG: microcin C ABC transporter permease YejB [Alphaproteobacteria bacterium]